MKYLNNYMKYLQIIVGGVEIGLGVCIWTGYFKPSVFNQGLTWIIFGCTFFLLYGFSRICDNYSKLIREILDGKLSQ